MCFARFAVGENTDVDVVNTLCGLLGIASILTLWPGIIVVNYIPALNETFKVPSASDCGYLALNGSLALVFNALFMLRFVIRIEYVQTSAAVFAHGSSLFSSQLL